MHPHRIVPAAIEALIAELGKLPGVGRRSAERVAYHLLNAGEEKSQALARAIERVSTEVGLCGECHFLTQEGRCPLCTDAGRDRSELCVVESPLDVIALEKAGGFLGLYHVLGGHLSPLRGVTPSDLTIQSLLGRVGAGGFREVVIATHPSVEGDATAHYLGEELRTFGVKLTRLGRGVPTGGSLEYADALTLRAAFDGRRDM